MNFDILFTLYKVVYMVFEFDLNYNCGIHQLLPHGTFGSEVEVHGFPEGAKINFVTWSPDGRHSAFTIRFDDENSSSQLKVWVAQVETGVARPLFESHEYCLHAVFDNFVWVNDSSLLVCTIPLSRGDPPKKRLVPFGPKIQSNEQKNIIQVRTFQDLLKDEYDEDLFDYYATSQLVLASLDGMVKEIGPPAAYTSTDPSPDHKYLLINFPRRLRCGADGKFVREICDLPLAEDIPIAFNSVRRGMRSLNWRADKPSTLYWYVYVTLMSNCWDILNDMILRCYVVKDKTIYSIRIFYIGVQLMIPCTNS
ncbi:putative transcription factor WD40-like family [Rosa chinensis]|uniref:Putative transcription factor WD40-like family n=1 Tax=Rosa chinensis TaxID=74649 RepID=A0A2P6QGG6_ROSCH|nr:putative transcription factor WD40-like family [Rosa chinensis]